MIYLIDDKKNRQKDYGWSGNKLEKYSEILKPIYSYDEILINNLSYEIFSENNVILFHESFFDAAVNTNHSKDLLKIREKIETTLEGFDNFKVAYFSGSKNSRYLASSKLAHLPVSVLYQNLETFLEKIYLNQIDFSFLLFGESYNLEKKLLEKLISSNNSIDELIFTPTTNNLILKSEQHEIEDVFDNAEYRTLFLNNDGLITDQYLNSKVNDWLNNISYDNIFIPLCFGPTLSDFNGLRLAMHIRCSDSQNRLKNIFLYSFLEDPSMLWNNEYFDILKTKNIELIEYKKVAFQKAVENNFKDLLNKELPFEIKKIKLNAPKNYEDSHSIANEWAIYRWSKTINVSDEKIEAIENKVESNLYFKYLKTIYPILESQRLNEEKLKINYSGNPKVLYIDDEFEKGWEEIFSELIGEINKIYFDCLAEDFKNISRDQLIKTSLKKIKDDNIDLVLLDFRLLPSDFSKVSTNEVSGVKLLKAIKDLNPGIQVVIFSATNKIWNLQKLQEFGADGFILKESPTNSIDVDFTRSSIENMIQVINNCFERKFLKDFYNKIDELKTELLPRKNFKKASNPLDVNFVDEILKWLQLSCELLTKNLNTASKTSAFLFLFSVLENLSNQIVSSEPIRIDNSSDIYFEFEFSRVNNRLVFFKENRETGEYTKTNNKLRASKPGISWAQKILNTLDYLNTGIGSELDLNEIIGKRNNIIHANSSLNGKLEISNKELINLFNTVYNGLKMI